MPRKSLAGLMPLPAAAAELGVKPGRLRIAAERQRFPVVRVRVLNYSHTYVDLEDARRYVEETDRRRSNVKAS